MLTMSVDATGFDTNWNEEDEEGGVDNMAALMESGEKLISCFHESQSVVSTQESDGDYENDKTREQFEKRKK